MPTNPPPQPPEPLSDSELEADELYICAARCTGDCGKWGCDRVARYQATVKAATERAARLLPYVQHRSTCDHNYGEGEAPCSCGLSAILAEGARP